MKSISDLRIFIRKVFSFLMRNIYQNETLFVFEINNHNEQTSVASIIHANPENLKDIFYFQDEKYFATFKHFLSIGDKGYLAYIDNRCIHRSWVKSNFQTVLFHWALPYNLQKDEIYIHYCETASNARGKNIYPHVLSSIVKEHYNKTILISTNKNNLASIVGIKKVGFEIRSIIQLKIIFGLKFIEIVL